MPYTAAQMKALRQGRKSALIARFGGVCVRCGSTEKLEFDHKDPSTLVFRISRKAYNPNYPGMEEELLKCQLLCWGCHHSKTLADNGWQDAKNVHGAPGSYVYCKCDACRAVNRKRALDWYYAHKRG